MNTLQKIQQTIDFIRSKTSMKPEVGIVLGSGLGAFANQIKIEVRIPFQEIPHFVAPTVEGHSGYLIFGHVEQKEVIILQGRNHFYEGHSMELVTYPTKVLARMGVQKLMLTNSAGGFADGMKAGDFMIIADHINMMGTNPLIGPNQREFGPRFPDMTEVYNKKLIQNVERACEKVKARYHKGVYCGMTGPSYETPAEIRFLKIIGGSAVGMSTVAEAIIANHMGLQVAGISCITNLAAGISSQKLSHDEVTETAKMVEYQFCEILKEFVLGST